MTAPGPLHPAIGARAWRPPRRWRSHLAGSAHGARWAVTRLRGQLLRLLLWRALRRSGTLQFPDGRNARIVGGDLTPLAHLYYRDALTEHGAQLEAQSSKVWRVRLADGLVFESPVETLFPLVEIFLDRVYEVPDVPLQDRFVVDAGTSIGDSTIFFAQQGAFVVGIEPNPIAYEFARRNVLANGMERTVQLLAKKLVARPGTSPGSTSLEEILGLTGRPRIDLLKLDCDGCESDVVLFTEAATLDRVTRLLVEYDHPPQAMCRRLRSLGYRVRRRGSRTNGYLYADRDEIGAGVQVGGTGMAEARA
ncbi:MAG: hypothetical protein L3J97_06670 [Thermoplasmata archaeon]|nr:hypothetical protein [Thermoplasmata archaeon]